MYKSIIMLSIKVASITLIILWIINLYSYFFGVKQLDTTKNKYNFKSEKIEKVADIWVAITTNIWIWFRENKLMESTIFNSNMSVKDIITTPERAKKEIVTKNMLIINEYLNILKTNVTNLINSDTDRKKTIEIFISELEKRYKNTVINNANLVIQRDTLVKEMEDTSQKIEDLKGNINTDFNSFNAEKTWANIEKYLELRKNYYYAKTYIIFINKFINQYIILNDYNKKLLDTIINNKDAIIKNAYIVLPDSWNELLKKLNLIYEETEYKALLEKEKTLNEEKTK